MIAPEHVPRRTSRTEREPSAARGGSARYAPSPFVCFFSFLCFSFLFFSFSFFFSLSTAFQHRTRPRATANGCTTANGRERAQRRTNGNVTPSRCGDGYVPSPFFSFIFTNYCIPMLQHPNATQTGKHGHTAVRQGQCEVRPPPLFLLFLCYYTTTTPERARATARDAKGRQPLRTTADGRERARTTPHDRGRTRTAAYDRGWVRTAAHDRGRVRTSTHDRGWAGTTVNGCGCTQHGRTGGTSPPNFFSFIFFIIGSCLSAADDARGHERALGRTRARPRGCKRVRHDRRRA